MREAYIHENNDALCGYVDIPSRDFKKILLFSHGLLSGVKESQRYTILKKCLHKHGIATAGFYYPGHGPRKSEQFSLQGCVDTLEHAIGYLQSNYSQKGIIVSGTSLGSTIISLLSKKHRENLKGAVLFSIVLNPARFLTYKFEQRHYDRWQTYGYTVGRAEEMFRILAQEAVDTNVQSRIVSNLFSFEPAKIFIHGLNDSVTNLHDITSVLDQNSSLMVFSGHEGTHDLKGLSLECACRHVANWIKLSA